MQWLLNQSVANYEDSGQQSEKLTYIAKLAGTITITILPTIEESMKQILASFLVTFSSAVSYIAVCILSL